MRDNRRPAAPRETGNGAGLLVEEGASAAVIGGGLLRNLTAGIVARPARAWRWRTRLSGNIVNARERPAAR